MIYPTTIKELLCDYGFDNVFINNFDKTITVHIGKKVFVASTWKGLFDMVAKERGMYGECDNIQNGSETQTCPVENNRQVS